MNGLPTQPLPGFIWKWIWVMDSMWAIPTSTEIVDFPNWRGVWNKITPINLAEGIAKQWPGCSVCVALLQKDADAPRIRWSWDVLRSSSMACWFMAWMTFLFPVVQVTLPCALRYLHRRKGSGTARGLRSSRRLDPPGSLLKLESHVVGQASSSSSWW